jgi:lysozyme
VSSTAKHSLDAWLVRRFEGCALQAYRDAAGLWTIGWGHLLPQAAENAKLAWTQEKADGTLESDLSWARKAVAKLQGAPFSLTRQAALVSFAFNLGVGSLANLAPDLAAGHHVQVANRMELYCHAGGKLVPGLAKRRAVEATLYLLGDAAGGRA